MADRDPFRLGHLVEGVVEQDPMTDRWCIRVPLDDGGFTTFDVQDALAELSGKEIRLTVVSFEDLQRLSDLVDEQGGSGEIMGTPVDDIAVPFSVKKR